MKSSQVLKMEIDKIDGKSYRLYKNLEGEYDFGSFVLCIDHVQGDPFASPSRIRVIVDQNISKFPKEIFDNKIKNIAVADFLTREFYYNINKCSEKVFGSGKSGLIAISKCPQEILDRTSIIIDEDKIEARFYVGFPARGRSVLARELEKILYNVIPNIVEKTLIYKNIDSEKLTSRVTLVEDQEYIRRSLKSLGLVAFVANGSILPRESGVSTKALKGGIAFASPKALEVEFNTKSHGKIRGMGIKAGITLIVGGGYHGKSTLLKALEHGVYNHIEGDGRELVITDESALKVRAEDSRCITKTNISLFISKLPNGKDTIEFSTENASGSTSEAASIIEGIESGAKVLLLDEDTSATNFMMRDDLMQKLVSKEKEPITPFIEIVRPLHKQNGISTIMVVGSSGEFFDVADSVIQLDNYEAKDVTKEAKKLSRGNIMQRIIDRDLKTNIGFNRVVKAGTITQGDKGIKMKTIGLSVLSINRDDIDLRAVEQIVDSEQVNAIGSIMKWAEVSLMNKGLNFGDMIDNIICQIDRNGLISMDRLKGGSGSLAMPRKQEIMATYNRYRKLKI
ncbi:ABC-ATPase domain-containing protein [Clostridium estertheticum]|uniref:Isopentenyl-diphosphate delta-isomerase n=1 Tax=Clostridium estertheticum subsp. estertheticum TaxID=1552 RepID=A0A1J0GGL7_9CLOT|nr:ABC-ATPase domain-containing protein [Clostridium estertheticum]APC40423.1 isopentenyl-diphosphate delta-isomerase [Clostridium estertheticum subsp. estertheticum]MBU3173110.1 ABC-ATPase domain-containing protein [Clostridium estertheticum]MBZ9617759.1 ABC-ATPase domain-containing protein [Clostridium estertheticum subsp. laramiense]WAG73431.1 ABC-ATPase domain-containing protein [Clostridium estertheticum]